jgi:hypothetical protein
MIWRLCLLGLVLLPGLAGAAEPPLLVYGPDGPSDEAEARAMRVWRQQALDRRDAPRLRHLSSLLSSLPGVELVGGGESVACPGSPVTAAGFEEGLEQALGHVQYVQLDEARQQLRRLDLLLSCLTDVLPREALAQISYLQGVAAGYGGDSDAAREGFRRALVVSPTLDWDPRFPPSLKAVFDEAGREALRSASAQYEVAQGAGESSDVYIDGRQLSGRWGGGTLAVGQHLVQWRRDGAMVTRALVLEPGDTFTVLAREDVASALLGGVGPGAAVERARGLLVRAAADVGVSTIQLVEFGDQDLLHAFAAASGAWSVADEGRVQLQARRRRAAQAGGGVAAAGGGTLAAGVVLGAVGFVLAGETASANATSPPTDQATWDERNSEYTTRRDAAQVGYVLAAVGGAAMAVGLPIAAVHSAPSRRPAPSSVQVAVWPSGGLSVSFGF